MRTIIAIAVLASCVTARAERTVQVDQLDGKRIKTKTPHGKQPWENIRCGGKFCRATAVDAVTLEVADDAPLGHVVTIGRTKSVDGKREFLSDAEERERDDARLKRTVEVVAGPFSDDVEKIGGVWKINMTSAKSRAAKRVNKAFYDGGATDRAVKDGDRGELNRLQGLRAVALAEVESATTVQQLKSINLSEFD
jgi:hypothetical protein